MRYALALVAVLSVASPAFAQVEIVTEPSRVAAHAAPELAHERRIAEAWRAAGVPTECEKHTADDARCDLLTAGTAWEIDWPAKWAECGGQARYYAKAFGRRAGMILLSGGAGDAKLIERGRLLAADLGAEFLVVPVDGDVPLPREAGVRAALPAGAAGKANGGSLSECPCSPSGGPCDCGPLCACSHCKGKGEAAEKPGVELAPQLVVTLWTAGCVHGDRWERECLPALERAGWRVQINRVEPTEATCPTFTFRGRTWTGYRNAAEFFGLIDTHKVSAPASPAPVRQPFATGFLPAFGGCTEGRCR